MDVEWWAKTLEERLSQGDLIERVTFGTVLQPGIPVARRDGQRGTVWDQKNIWAEKGDQGVTCIAKGKLAMAVVVSHSCQLDKPESQRRVLVAPVHDLHRITPEAKNKILAQEHYSHLPLPGVPDHGDLYADLRLITAVDRDELNKLVRIASMTREARARLKEQLFSFLCQPEEGDAGFEEHRNSAFDPVRLLLTPRHLASQPHDQCLSPRRRPLPSGSTAKPARRPCGPRHLY